MIVVAVLGGCKANPLFHDDAGGDGPSIDAGPVCGNGIIETGESCDDGNTADGDGCNSTCTVASCFVPVTHPTIAAALADSQCSTIDVYSGTYEENLSIGRTISLVGVGAKPSIVDGQGSASVVTISTGAVVLATLTIQNGRAAKGGGINNAGTLTLMNSIVQTSTASGAIGQGAGIYNSGAALTLQATQVTGNHTVATETNAAGAGIYSADGTVTITGGSIDTNDIAISGIAGALATGGGIDFEGGALQITGTTIANNTITVTGTNAQARGGGLYVSPTAVAATGISNATITGNAVEVDGDGFQLGAGGGAELDGKGALTVSASTISGNTMTVTTSGASKSATAQGAGLGTTTSGAAIDGTSISMNTLTASAQNASMGTANASGGGLSASGSSLTCSQSTIANNTASATGGSGGTGIANGGGLNASSTVATLTISQSTINGNTANGGTTAQGGGVAAAETAGTTTVIVVDSTLSGNTAQSTTSYGGGLFLSAQGTAVVHFNSSTITGNVASDIGGAFVIDGIQVAGTPSISATLANTISTGNTGADADCAALGIGTSITSSGYNAFGTLGGCGVTATTGDQVNTDVMLGALANNGGPTFTHALLPGSTAIDAANPAGCSDASGAQLSQDQRGQPRVDNERCDIGAFEK
jgi:cysteine-rich repeat protein